MNQIIITQGADTRNKGDEAILKATVTELARTLNDAQVFLCTPFNAEFESVSQRWSANISVGMPLIGSKVGNRNRSLGPFYIVTTPFQLLSSTILRLSRTEIYERFRNASIIISAGGGYLREVDPGSRGLRGWMGCLFMIAWLANDVIVAKKVRKPFVIFPQSIGPFKTSIMKGIVKKILDNVDLIFVRDGYSNSLMHSIGVKNVFEVPDVAWALEPSTVKFRDSLAGPTIGVSPHFLFRKNRTYIEAHSLVLDELVDNYRFKVIFLPSRHVSDKKTDDSETAHLIRNGMRNWRKAEVVNVKSSEHLESLISQLDLLITTRMHPAIFAAMHTIPFLLLVHEPKQTGLLQQLGLEEVSLEVNDVSYSSLKAKVMFVREEQQRLRAVLASRVPVLRKQIRKAISNCLVHFTRQA